MKKLLLIVLLIQSTILLPGTACSEQIQQAVAAQVAVCQEDQAYSQAQIAILSQELAACKAAR
jgi:hypothetical protein